MQVIGYQTKMCQTRELTSVWGVLLGRCVNDLDTYLYAPALPLKFGRSQQINATNPNSTSHQANASRIIRICFKAGSSARPCFYTVTAIFTARSSKTVFHLNVPFYEAYSSSSHARGRSVTCLVLSLVDDLWGTHCVSSFAQLKSQRRPIHHDSDTCH